MIFDGTRYGHRSFSELSVGDLTQRIQEIRHTDYAINQRSKFSDISKNKVEKNVHIKGKGKIYRV
jgi:hypothetical protein